LKKRKKSIFQIHIWRTSQAIFEKIRTDSETTLHPANYRALKSTKCPRMKKYIFYVPTLKPRPRREMMPWEKVVFFREPMGIGKYYGI
jgi:hypothetical protein